MDQGIENIFIFKLSPAEALANLLVALLCGILITFFYRATYRGVSYSANYVISIIMLSMITALVIMVIGNNLARAFGLVGAMSIIRFRTAVKDTQDIMYIFFALATGLACGAGMYMIGLLGTLTIGFSLLGVTLVYGENPTKREYLLQVMIMDTDDLQSRIQTILNEFCSRSKLINIKSLEDNRGELLELSYYVKFKKDSKSQQMVSTLKKMDSVAKVNLFYDED